MKYRKPALLAGLGAVAGAASVALWTALVPAPDAPSSLTPLVQNDSALTPPAAKHGSEPATMGPRTAAKTRAAAEAQPTATAGPAPALTKVALPGQAAVAASPRTREKVLTVARGDTLMKMLTGAGVPRKKAYEAIEALREVYDPRDLRPGDKVTVSFRVGGDAENAFQGLTLTPDPSRKVRSAVDDSGAFTATEIKAKLSEETLRFEGEISSSLFMAAAEVGVPPRILAEVIKVFSYDVDFQRDIQKGDRFALMFTRKVAPSGAPVGEFDLSYASMTLSGEKVEVYRYEDANGEADYYHPNGQSVRKALMRTPINGARLSSGFGRRKHPVLGYTKMHKGIDFAAPTGTPIFAAGDGVVEKAGRWGGYGNYIRIRHNSEFSTAYAHMHRLAKGMQAGKRVRQGDVIGYVGSTGRSTGPHLHYEILKNGGHVNPLKVRFPSGRKLKGKELEEFQSARADIQQTYASLPANQATAIAKAE